MGSDTLVVAVSRSGDTEETLQAAEEAQSSGGRLLLEGLDNMRARLGTAVEAGVHVLTGTDLAIGTHQVAQEAIRLWELGMPTEQVIESVSRSGYRSTGRPADFATGDPANAVLFSEDPVSNPRVLSDPALVIRMGRIV